jgi:hypothetical protein
VILVAALLAALALMVLLWPVAKLVGTWRRRRGLPTWWNLKLRSGDVEAALADDRAAEEARADRAARRRAALARWTGRGGDPAGDRDDPA